MASRFQISLVLLIVVNLLSNLNATKRSFNVEVQWWSRRIVHLGRGLKAMSLPRPSIGIRCDLVTSFLSQ